MFRGTRRTWRQAHTQGTPPPLLTRCRTTDTACSTPRPAEEAYVAKIIHDFSTGTLPAEDGATLRSYLSEKLNCDPMR